MTFVTGVTGVTGKGWFLAESERNSMVRSP